VVLFLAIIPISIVSVPADGAERREHVSMLRFVPKAPLLLTAIYVRAIFDGGMLGFLSIYACGMG
jgi:hypothetical protein